MLLVSKLAVLGDNPQVEPLEDERERTTPLAGFDCVFLTRENADTLPLLHCRNHGQSRTGATCCERKDPTSYLISFLVDWRILLNENELSMKVFQEAMIRSCVEVAMRDMKRQRKILRTSAEPNTSVRVTDDTSFLNWIPHFAVQFLNKMRTGRRWRKPMVQS